PRRLARPTPAQDVALADTNERSSHDASGTSDGPSAGQARVPGDLRPASEYQARLRSRGSEIGSLRGSAPGAPAGGIVCRDEIQARAPPSGWRRTARVDAAACGPGTKVCKRSPWTPRP